MADLVPIRVRLYRRTADLDDKRKAGQADWPPWGELSDEVRRGLEGGQVIDVHGTGWIGYDKVESLGTGHTHGRAIALVPEDFAEAAHARWPHLVEVLDDAEAEAFWADRVALSEPEHLVDDRILDRIYKLSGLEAIGAKSAPSQAELSARAEALDPDHPAGGLKRNPRKSWARMKQANGWGGRVKVQISRRPIQPAPPDWVSGRGK